MGVNADRKTILSMLKEPVRASQANKPAEKAEWARLARALRGLK